MRRKTSKKDKSCGDNVDNGESSIGDDFGGGDFGGGEGAEVEDVQNKFFENSLYTHHILAHRQLRPRFNLLGRKLTVSTGSIYYFFHYK